MFAHIRITVAAVLAALTMLAVLAMSVGLSLGSTQNTYWSEGVRISANQETTSAQGARDGVRISADSPGNILMPFP